MKDLYLSEYKNKIAHVGNRAFLLIDSIEKEEAGKNIWYSMKGSRITILSPDIEYYKDYSAGACSGETVVRIVTNTELEREIDKTVANIKAEVFKLKTLH